MKNLVNKVYQSAKNVEKKTARALAIASLGIASLMPYSARAQSPVLDDYLSTTTTNVYHVSVDKDPQFADDVTSPSTMRHWKGIPNYTTIIGALTDDYSSSTSLPVRLHIMPGEWSEGYMREMNIPSNRQLVGQNASVVGNKDYEKGINGPAVSGTTILSKLQLDGTTTSTLVNLIMKGTPDGLCLFIEGDNVLVYNNFFAGVKDNPTNAPQGITISELSKNININNNVFWRFGRSNLLDPAVGDRGQTKIRNNIIAESVRALTIYNTSKVNLGNAEDPGNNVFVGNSDRNIWAQIGDVNEIPAKFNTWYPVGRIRLQGVDSVYGDPLTNETDIQNTNFILNPGGGIRLEAVKRILVYPFNFGDPRFGYVPLNGVRNSGMYE